MDSDGEDEWEDDRPPLLLAAYEGDVHALRRAIADGADVMNRSTSRKRQLNRLSRFVTCILVAVSFVGVHSSLPSSCAPALIFPLRMKGVKNRTCRGLPTRAGGRRTVALTSTSSPCCSRRSRRLVKGAAARSAAGLLFMACRPSLSGASWSTGRTRATRCLRAISSCELPTDLVRKNSTSRKFHKSPYQGRKVAPTRTAPRPRRRRRRGGPPRNRRRPGGRPRGHARRSPRRVLA